MAEREKPLRPALAKAPDAAARARGPRALAPAPAHPGAAAQLAMVHRIWTSGAPPGGVVQLALEKGKLNVAGETHDKSAVRRAQEAGFATHKLGAGAKYWKEDELTTTKSSMLFWSKTVPADAPELRFRHTILYFKNAWEGYGAAGDNPRKTAAKENMALLNTRITEEISRPDIEAPAHKPNVLVITNNLGLLIKMLDPPGMEGAALLLKYPDAPAPQIQKYIARLEQYASINSQGKTTAALGAETMLARSQGMYAAAKAGAAQNGVWMVGERHREQMAEMPKAAFALTSKDEFDEQFAAWMEPQQKADGPDRKIGMAEQAYLAWVAAPASASASSAAAATHSAATTAAPPTTAAAVVTAAGAPAPATATATAPPLATSASAGQSQQSPASAAAAAAAAASADLAAAQLSGPPAAATGFKPAPPRQEMS